MIAVRGTVVGKLRILAAEANPQPSAGLVTRLASARLTASGLGPSGILAVRRMTDPMPRTLGVDGSRPVEPAWERAAQAALDRAAVRAARPAIGPVPASAEAVLFTDHAELIACLACDWLTDDLWSRWWWRWLLRPAHPPDGPILVWLQSPRCVPVALELLAVRGTAVAFARRVPPPTAKGLAAAVAKTFGLTGQHPSFGPAERARGEYPRLAAPAAQPGRAMAASSTAPPWQGWVPEADTENLSPEQRLLLGLGLALRRTPALPRQASFWRAAWTWTAHASAGADFRSPENANSPYGAKLATSSRPAPGDTPPLEERPSRTPGSAGPCVAGDEHADTTDPAAAARTSSQEASRKPRDLAMTSATSESASAITVAREGRKRNGAPARTIHPRSSTTITADVPELDLPEVAPPPQALHAVATRLGGLFYLLNLGLGLGLYRDFTTPASPGVALDVWDFVTLLGQELLGRPAWQDPVWAVLARLAGRKVGEQPGRGFDPPPAWRVSRDWLVPFQPHPGVWRWSAAGGRLRLEHAAGFPALDLPATGGSAVKDQLRRELDALDLLPAAVLRRCALPPLPAPPLRRWVVALAAYARARLSRALGHPPGRVAEVLLRHQATVFVTHVHVDVALSLAELPIEIRVAELDRDPGWIPAAGRVVAFHFD